MALISGNDIGYSNHGYGNLPPPLPLASGVAPRSIEQSCLAHCACGPYPPSHIVQHHFQRRADKDHSDTDSKPSTKTGHADKPIPQERYCAVDDPAKDIDADMKGATNQGQCLSHSPPLVGETSLHRRPLINRAESSNSDGEVRFGDSQEYYKSYTCSRMSRHSLSPLSYGSRNSAEQALSDTSKNSTARSRVSYTIKCEKPDCGRYCRCNAKGKIRCQGYEHLGPRSCTQLCRPLCRCEIETPQQQPITARTAYEDNVFARGIHPGDGSPKELLGHLKMQNPPSHRNNSPARGGSRATNTTLVPIPPSSSQGSSTTDASIKLLNERAPALSRETSAVSRPATDPATRPVLLRQRLIPWCGNMLGLTGPLCINYCSCNSYYVITCSEGLKGMKTIEQDIHSGRAIDHV